MDLRLEKTLSNYVTRYKIFDEGTSNRTMANRLEDHEIFLSGLFDKSFPKYQVLLRNSNFNWLREVLYRASIARTSETLFIDIGPGLANPEGLPAITSLEIAHRFPGLDVLALDLQQSVDIFMGRKSGIWKRYSGRTLVQTTRYRVADFQRAHFLRPENIHILAGNGLKSIKEQYLDPKTNPVDRKRPKLGGKKTIIVRNANATDIYCDWNSTRKCGHSNRKALRLLARDFKEKGILYFYNRTIMIKRPSSLRWIEAGITSNRGFNHRTRTLTRGGMPPFVLFKPWRLQTSRDLVFDFTNRRLHYLRQRRIFFSPLTETAQLSMLVSGPEKSSRDH